MPIFASLSGSRRRIFRFFSILLFWMVLASTFVFITGLLIPESRSPISHGEAFDAYNYYYSPTNEKKIALTFDDGPTPEDTKAIVEVLKAYDIPATFFFIGQHVLAYPEVARYVAEEGYSIGNHSFTHRFSVHDSPQRLAFELAATTRIIERTTGVRTSYYRPPFLLAVGIDPAPNPWIDTVEEDQWALALGYLPIGSDIDPHDWDAKTPQEIIGHLNEQLAHDRHIALFHDTPETAQAIKEVIPTLLAQGYEIVPLEELLTPPDLRGTFAPVAILQPPVAPLETAYIYLIAHLRDVFVLLGTVAVGLVLVRLGLLAYLLQRKRKEPKLPLNKYPMISVIIPAYNEEENIESAVRSVLHNSYPRREIIVIDDGSTDRTATLVKKMCKNLPYGLVRLIELENGGKARALTIGAKEAQGDVLVVLDADAVLAERALHAFVKHFADLRVGAVAGKVYTTNLNGFLSRFQALEYSIGQNLEKRAFSVFGAVGVVPGPAGAWRKTAVLEAGGFPTDTLVEDQDMTLTLMRAGYRVVYEPEAIAYTETPATLRNFLAQRFRWVYGGIQCFWKHAGVVFERPRSAMSLLIVPHMFIFGIALPLTYPIVDSVLIGSVFFGLWREALIPILIFTCVDTLYAFWGLRGEPHSWRLLAMVPLLRFVYRQLLYYTVLRGLVRAIEGSGAAWNKFAKVGDTKAFYEENFKSLPINTGVGYDLAPGTGRNLSLVYKAPTRGSVSVHS